MLPPDVHGTAMLEDNSMTLKSVCDSVKHIFAIIPSRQLQPSDSPSLMATMTQSLASPAHMKHQELINLVLSLNNALRFKDQLRMEQQDQFQETMQSFKHDLPQREEDSKQNFQRYTKDIERQLKDNQHQTNILKQERSLDQSRIKFLEDRQQEDRLQIKDLEALLLKEKKIRMDEKEHSENERIAMLTRIEEIEDKHITAAGWVSGAVSILYLMEYLMFESSVRIPNSWITFHSDTYLISHKRS
jgi:hypothetical protein